MNILYFPDASILARACHKNAADSAGAFDSLDLPAWLFQAYRILGDKKNVNNAYELMLNLADIIATPFDEDRAFLCFLRAFVKDGPGSLIGHLDKPRNETFTIFCAYQNLVTFGEILDREYDGATIAEAEKAEFLATITQSMSRLTEATKPRGTRDATIASKLLIGLFIAETYLGGGDKKAIMFEIEAWLNYYHRHYICQNDLLSALRMAAADHPYASNAGAGISAGDFQVWLEAMKSAGHARNDADCASLLGFRDVDRQKKRGGDLRLALACSALLAGIRPYVAGA